MKVSVTLSMSIRSLVRGRGEFAETNAHLGVWQDSWSPNQVAFPASLLGDKAVERWLTQHHAVVDVRRFAELNRALAAGIDPSLMTVHCSGFDVAQIWRMAGLGVGRVVVSSDEHIDAITGRLDSKVHNVILRIGEATPSGPTRPCAERGFARESSAADLAAERVFAHPSLKLIGLHGEIGCAEVDFVSGSAAVGCLMAQMDLIRRQSGVLLTALSLGTTRQYADETLNRRCATEIAESVDDACAIFRYPRPVVSVAVFASTLE